ncbi:sugar transferase [Clostridium sp. CM028]|uniref:sugar transferase n=1 Tax=unclassified Clostridium TaxID=2614128 RepID=UPI001C0CDEC3|nr:MULTISPECIES: sugar transferase [unclassified Clostridium]MBU3091650.1 sugar transferase [Clostridium sp. CF011]MBW9144848.1 sugar transferase [Clostridium sp. CM027]MBW9149316.1 sugar transferase [Clostridium sp. CM028]UVE40411.1 sugar transferase [Clostridium sp. CM027]WAG69363.1 sugar transferase [Clostridium sp. CF011]
MEELETDMRETQVKITSEYEKNAGYFIIKRITDVIGALCGILLLSPVMVVVAIWIKIDSKGPVFFGHKRLGMNGEFIKVYKFRTMLPNAEELLKKLTPKQEIEFEKSFKLENDPRITKFGQFLRKSSLDELPQLLNILKGNMSIVGPRPIIEREIENYGIYGDKLLSVKPGLTGNWQASGRSDTTYDERVQLDMNYIDYRSVWVDLKIIFKTFGAVVNKQGAR